MASVMWKEAPLVSRGETPPRSFRTVCQVCPRRKCTSVHPSDPGIVRPIRRSGTVPPDRGKDRSVPEEHEGARGCTRTRSAAVRTAPHIDPDRKILIDSPHHEYTLRRRCLRLRLSQGVRFPRRVHANIPRSDTPHRERTARPEHRARPEPPGSAETAWGACSRGYHLQRVQRFARHYNSSTPQRPTRRSSVLPSFHGASSSTSVAARSLSAWPAQEKNNDQKAARRSAGWIWCSTRWPLEACWYYYTRRGTAIWVFEVGGLPRAGMGHLTWGGSEGLGAKPRR